MKLSVKAQEKNYFLARMSWECRSAIGLALNGLEVEILTIYDFPHGHLESVINVVLSKWKRSIDLFTGTLSLISLKIILKIVFAVLAT